MKARHIALIIIPVLIALLSMRSFLFSPGVIYYGEWVSTEDFSKGINRFFHSWNEGGLGGTMIGFPGGASGFYLESFFLIVEKLLGSDPTKLFFLLAVGILPFYSMYLLAGHLVKDAKRRDVTAWISALAYTISYPVLWRVTAGHVTYVFCYALFPALIFCYLKFKDKYLEENSLPLKYILYGALLIAMMEQLTPHFVILWFIFVGFDTVVSLLLNRKIKEIVPILIFSLSILMVSIVLNVHMFLPSALYHEPAIGHPGYFSIAQVEGISRYATVLNLLRLNWWVFPEIPTVAMLGYGYILLSALCLIALPKNKNVIYFSMLLIFGIFMSKGTNPPLESFTLFLYMQVPFMQAFRDLTKFIIFISLAYSIITGIFSGVAVDAMGKGVKYVTNSVHIEIKPPAKIFKKIFILILLTWLMAYNWSYFTGDFMGTVVCAKTPDGYSRLDSWLSEQEEDFRILYLPTGQWMSDYNWYPDSTNPAYLHPPYRLYTFGKPLSNTMWTETYSSRFMAYVAGPEQMNNPDLFAYLLEKTNTKYVVIDNTLKSSSRFKQTAENYKQTLEEGSSFEKVETGLDDFTVFRNKVNRDSPFIASPNAFFVVGDLNVYKALHDLSPESIHIPVIFAHQLREEQLDLLKKAHVGIIFYNTDENDFIADILKNSYEADLFEYVMANTDPNHQWISYAPYIGPIYNRGLVIESKTPIYTRGKANLTMPLDIKSPEKHDVYLRALLSDNAGKISIYFNRNFITHIDLKTATYVGFKWFHLGSFSAKDGRMDFVIQNDGTGEVLLDGFVVAPSEVYTEKRELVDSLLSEKGFVALHSLDRLEMSGYVSIGRRGIRLDMNKGFVYSDDFETEQYLEDSYSVSNLNRTNVEGGFYNYYLGTSPVEGGPSPFVGYSTLIYKLTTEAPIETLTAEMSTMWIVNFKNNATIEFSSDGETWTVVNMTSWDTYGDLVPMIADLTSQARGLRTVYIKFSMYDGCPLNGNWLTSIKIYGTLDLSPYNIGINTTNIHESQNRKIDLWKFFNFTEEPTEIYYEKISPAEYKISIGTNIPIFLEFRNSYSPNWKLGDENPIIVDYYANGYYIEENGAHVLTYKPEEIYRTSLLLSILFFATTIIAVVWLEFRERRIWFTKRMKFVDKC